MLASGDIGGAVRLWDVADPAHPRLLGQTLTGSTAPVAPTAFSPDWHTLASGGADGVVRLWDVADPAHPRLLGQTPLTRPLGQVLSNYTPSITSMTFSPDGHTLASGDDEGVVRLWEVTDPANPRLLGQPLSNGDDAAIEAAVFSPEGKTLASGSDDGTVRLWDVGDPAQASLLGQTLASSAFAVLSVAFSPRGNTLASGGDDGTVRLWDVGDPAHPRTLGQPLTSGGVSIDSVAFNPDGHRLASGGDDGTVRLWDVGDPAHPRTLGQPLTSGGVSVDSVAFSSGGPDAGQRQPRWHHPALEPECPARHRMDLHHSRRPHAPAVEPVHPQAAVPAILRSLAPKVHLAHAVSATSNLRTRSAG